MILAISFIINFSIPNLSTNMNNITSSNINENTLAAPNVKISFANTSILKLLLSNLQMKDKQVSYNLRKPFDLIDSLNKKTPPKIGGVAIGDPNEIRTRVTAVKGRCPRPLDDGTIY